MFSIKRFQVLTANIAILLDLYGVERGLDHYRSTSTLNFKHYHYYLMEEVFSSIPHNITLAQQRNFETKIDEVCWLICRKKYLRSTQNDSDERIPTNNNSKTKNNCVYKLFRLFCMFGDLIETDEDNEEDCCRVRNFEYNEIMCIQFISYLFAGVTSSLGSFLCDETIDVLTRTGT